MRTECFPLRRSHATSKVVQHLLLWRRLASPLLVQCSASTERCCSLCDLFGSNSSYRRCCKVWLAVSTRNDLTLWRPPLPSCRPAFSFSSNGVLPCLPKPVRPILHRLLFSAESSLRTACRLRKIGLRNIFARNLPASPAALRHVPPLSV